MGSTQAYIPYTQWLLDQLKSRNINNIKDVMLAGLQTDGQLYVSFFEENNAWQKKQ